MPYLTIGHSTRSVEDLVSLLREGGADLVADVRTVPRSRTNPQFNVESLPGRLAEDDVLYRHLPKLGGLRGHRKDSPSPNGFWENASFRNYADYAMTAPFRDGLDELRALATRHTCAIMCAEVLWWRCHRRIITDYLLAAGEPVAHILGPRHIEPATMTRGARPQADGSVLYPPQQPDPG